MKKKLYIIIGIIMSICLLFGSCGVKEETNKKTNSSNGNTNYAMTDNEDSDYKFKFKEMSDISTMSVNQMVKYTDEYTDAKLYEWSDDIVFPFPMPETEGAEAYIGDYGVEVSGIDEQAWKDYCKLICDNYYVIAPYGDVIEYGMKYDDSKEVSGFRIVDMKQNYIAYINWIDLYEDVDIGVKYDDIMQVSVQFGNQEDNSELSSEEVLDKVIEKLGVTENKELFYICDITSHSNIDAGFEVYYVVIPYGIGLEYELENGIIYHPNNALCVVKDNEIVFYKNDYLVYETGFTFNNEVEFVNVDGIWEMYVLRLFNNDLGSSLKGEQLVDKYILKDGYFELENQYSVIRDLKICDDVEPRLTFEKNVGTIDFHIIDEDLTKPIWERYSLGEKVGTLMFK